jgi:hypothetical protein
MPAFWASRGLARTIVWLFSYGADALRTSQPVLLDPQQRPAAFAARGGAIGPPRMARKLHHARFPLRTTKHA